jgi:hypothetical protein
MTTNNRIAQFEKEEKGRGKERQEIIVIVKMGGG